MSSRNVLIAPSVTAFAALPPLTSFAAPVATRTSADLMDVTAPAPFGGPPPLVATALAALCLLAVVIVLVKKRSRLVPEAPLRDPASLLSLLDAVFEDFFQRRCTADALCSGIAGIVRQAIAGSSSFPVNCLTTEELLRLYSERNSLPTGCIDEARTILSFLDRVKFGSYQPDAPEVQWLRATSLSFLHKATTGGADEVS